ncbi:MAG: hypothetical protein H6873_07150 [Hyphomicrobiaceae bacterium]|nr:hypothetical protein [Hyphomicrobiaceae bacterium]
MAIIRSAFWLGIAFLAVGPHADLGSSATGLAQGALGVGTAYAKDQIAAIVCEDLSCATNVTLATAGLDVVQQMAAPEPSVVTGPAMLDAPYPAPRTTLRN